MKITQLAAKPQLVKITLDTPELVEEFGEAIDFYTWDRQPLDIFMKLASSNGTDNSGLVNVLRTLILDETGQQVIQGEVTIPTKILVAAMAAITDVLGK
jgi:hypothetical protein